MKSQNKSAVMKKTKKGGHLILKEISKPKKKKKLGKSYNWQFWAIIALPMIYAFVFAYIPMGGIIVAFQKYSPRKGILGSEWVGLKYF